jgi:predicted SpoU family rRNA methylase
LGDLTSRYIFSHTGLYQCTTGRLTKRTTNNIADLAASLELVFDGETETISWEFGKFGRKQLWAMGQTKRTWEIGMGAQVHTTMSGNKIESINRYLWYMGNFPGGRHDAVTIA